MFLIDVKKLEKMEKAKKKVHKKVLVSARQNLKKSKNNHHMRVKDAEGSAKCARSAYFALPEASFASLFRRSTLNTSASQHLYYGTFSLLCL